MAGVETRRGGRAHHAASYDVWQRVGHHGVEGGGEGRQDLAQDIEGDGVSGDGRALHNVKVEGGEAGKDLRWAGLQCERRFGLESGVKEGNLVSWRSSDRRARSLLMASGFTALRKAETTLLLMLPLKDDTKRL